MAHAHGASHQEGQIHVHVVPPKVLLGVFGALMVLTIITVGVTSVDLGPFSIYVALLIAVIKAALVALYFMHLRWDRAFNAIILISALFFVAIFIGATLTDSGEYKVNYTAPLPSQVAPQ